jgi:hypothetical protein
VALPLPSRSSPPARPGPSSQRPTTPARGRTGARPSERSTEVPPSLGLSRHRQRRSPRKKPFFLSDKLSPPRHCPGVNLTGIAPFLWLRWADLLALAWPLRGASLVSARTGSRPSRFFPPAKSNPLHCYASARCFSAAALSPHPFAALRPFWQAEPLPPTRSGCGRARVAHPLTAFSLVATRQINPSQR